MSFSYDRYERQRRQTHGSSTRRSALGYWLPLALTLTVATVGAAAWIWNERRDDDGEDDSDGSDSSGRNQPGPHGRVNLEERSTGREGERQHVDDESIMSRMSGALRRTPSPQQLLDGASKKVAAGVAAAGAVVGGALSSIREEDKDDYGDHSRWSEEAEALVTGTKAQSTSSTRAAEATLPAYSASDSKKGSTSSRHQISRKKTAAIVVSAEARGESYNESDTDYDQEHAVRSSGSCLADLGCANMNDV